MAILLLLLFVLLCNSTVYGSRDIPRLLLSRQSSSQPCLCPQSSGTAQHAVLLAGGDAPVSLLSHAGQSEQHVLMKVRMLPAAAGTFLQTVKQGGNSTTGPEAWVAALINSTAAAAADQLKVPMSLLRVTIESSLGAGLNVPLAPAARQQAAVDALAEFFEETTGAGALLVGLNMIPTATAAQAAASNSANTSSAQDSMGSSPGSSATVLALATVNGPLGDLAHALHMAHNMELRCHELFQQDAVLNLTTSDSPYRKTSSSSCAAWLSDWYLPVLQHPGDLQPGVKAASLPPGAAALQRAQPPASLRSSTVYQATVAMPLEVNIKLSIKLSLPPHAADPETLISGARAWLQSAALDQMLQQHGLHIGAGSPAHLVTLMSTPVAAGRQRGVADVSEDDGSSDSDVPQHPQAEMGLAHRPSASSMGVWGRLQPQELQHLIPGTDPAKHQPGPGTGPHKTDDGDVSRRTVQGAIAGAVLGSAGVGAGLAMAVVVLLRKRRAGQGPGGVAGRDCCSASADGEGGHGRGTRMASSKRRRSRKRYLKYLPNMLPPTHVPGHAPAVPSCASSSLAAAANSPTACSTAPSEDGGAGSSGHYQQQQGPAASPQLWAGGIGSDPAAICALDGAGSSSGVAAVAAQAEPTAGAGHAMTHQHTGALALQQSGSAQQPQQQTALLLGQHSQSGTVTQLEQHHMQDNLRSRLVHGFALLRQAASDPLLQPQARGLARLSASRASIHNRSDLCPSGSHSAVTRAELCSDSVSSAARVDLQQALQRSTSGSSSEDGNSSTNRRNSSECTSPAGGSTDFSPTAAAGAVSSGGQPVSNIGTGCFDARATGAQSRGLAAAEAGPLGLEGHAGCCLDVSGSTSAAAATAACGATPGFSNVYTHTSESPSSCAPGRQSSSMASSDSHDPGLLMLQAPRSSSSTPLGYSDHIVVRCSGDVPSCDGSASFCSTSCEWRSTGGISAGRKAPAASPFLQYNFAAALDLP